MARKCKEDAEKTRQAVLESALDVFSEKGFAKATFDEIAARAGFTKGAVYWYFRNKADLVSALILEFFEQKRQEVLAQMPECHSLDDLLNYFLLWGEFVDKDERYAKFSRFILCQMEWSETIIKRVDKAVYPAKDWHLEKIKQVLVELKANGKLKDDVDIDQLQFIFIATYQGICFSYLSKRHQFGLKEMLKTGLGLLFDSIRK